jgi:rubrerythrin
MKPDGPVIEQAIFGEPCGECAAGNPAESYERFAETLIRRLIERSGIRPRYPVPKVGAYVDSDADSKFLRTEPRPKSDDPKAVHVWVDQMIEILHNPNRQYLHSEVLNRLVPISDPLRYKDSRIDAALTDILHRDLEAAAKFKPSPEPPELDPSKFQDVATLEKDAKKYEEKENKRREEERRIDNLRLTASSAAEKLGFHDAVNAFPELLRLAASPELFSPASSTKVPLSWPFNQALIAASAIAGKHPELRPALIEFLKSQFAGFSDKSEMPAYLLEAAWRADLRDLAPLLQEIANAKPAHGKDTAEQSGNRLHEAQVILTAWKETDPLTKTKLDIMLTGDIGGGNSIPEVLRKEFEDLSKEDQLTIRNFVNWLRTVDVPWSRRYIEHIFTPHTPRPDIPIER